MRTESTHIKVKWKSRAQPYVPIAPALPSPCASPLPFDSNGPRTASAERELRFHSELSPRRPAGRGPAGATQGDPCLGPPGVGGSGVRNGPGGPIPGDAAASPEPTLSGHEAAVEPSPRAGR